jgi:O-antigen biosynthesis protein WbqP
MGAGERTRDDLPIPVKVEFDEYYLKNMSFFFDLKTRLP